MHDSFLNKNGNNGKDTLNIRMKIHDYLYLTVWNFIKWSFIMTRVVNQISLDSYLVKAGGDVLPFFKGETKGILRAF